MFLITTPDGVARHEWKLWSMLPADIVVQSLMIAMQTREGIRHITVSGFNRIGYQQYDSVGMDGSHHHGGCQAIAVHGDTAVITEINAAGELTVRCMPLKDITYNKALLRPGATP